MIQVTALGSLDVRDEAGNPVSPLLAQPRRAALLAYLAIEASDRDVARDTLLGMFWPESDETRGRAALRQALAFLRRSIGTDILRRGSDASVGIDPAHLACDVGQFRRAMREGRFADADALYRGELLAGLIVAESPEFEQWCASLRLSLARDAALAAAHVAEDRAAHDDWSGAIAHARRAQAIAPFDEEHHGRLLRYLDRSGDRAGAIMEHEAFAARLGAELDVAPAPETVALVAALRERTVPRSVSHDSRIDSSDTERVSPAAPADSRIPGIVRTTSDHVQADVAESEDAPRRASRGTSHTPLSWVRGRRGLTIVALLAAAGLMWAAWSARSTPASNPSANLADARPARTRFIVIPLSVDIRDPSRAAVGRMAADWILEGISRIPDIEVVPVTAVLAAASASADSTPAGQRTEWRALASELGAGVAVYGVVYEADDTLHFQANVASVALGTLLRPVERVSVPVDSIMVGIDRLRGRVLAAIAPLTDTVTHLRLAVAPPTYEAYRDYVAGLEAFVAGDTPRALDLFTRSASADTTYAMPRIAAAITYANLDDADGAARILAPLLSDRDRLGPLERATLDMIRGMLEGDLAGTYDAVVRQSRIAPGTIGEYMVGELARKMNRPDEAIAVLRGLGPDRGELRGWRPYWRELTFALHLRGNHAEELTAAREARRRYPTDVAMITYEVRAHAALGDRDALDESLASLEAAPTSATARASARLTAVTEWLAHGGAHADALVQDVTAWFDQLPPDQDSAAAVRRLHARLLTIAGQPDRALARLAPLLASGVTPPPAMATLGAAGVASAAAGDTTTARRWMAALAARSAAMTAAERGLSAGEADYRRAVIAAQLGDSAAAVALLSEARRLGLGIEPSVHAEPAFAPLRLWPPFAALLAPVALEPTRRAR